MENTASARRQVQNLYRDLSARRQAAGTPVGKNLPEFGSAEAWRDHACIYRGRSFARRKMAIAGREADLRAAVPIGSISRTRCRDMHDVRCFLACRA